MENMEKVVYLDNAATTPCAPEALEMMVKALSGACGNPSSHYSIGYEAKEFVDTDHTQVEKAIKANPTELNITSCDTTRKRNGASGKEQDIQGRSNSSEES